MTIEEADTFVRENPGAVVVADIGLVRLPEGHGKHRAVTS